MTKIYHWTLAVYLVFLSLCLNAQCDLRDQLQKVYYSQLHVREATGHNDGSSVECYLKDAGLDKGSPWCAAFVYWCYHQVGIRPIIAYPALASAYFTDSYNIYKRNAYKRCSPNKGDLIGIYFKEKGRIAHIGFYDGEDGDYYITIEGNTNQAGSREGDGVYKKYRPKGTIEAISSILK